MSDITSGTNTNNMSSAAKTGAKRVAKKTEVTVTVAAPVVEAAPVKKAAAKKAVAAPVEVVATAAATVAAAPEAQAVAQAAPVTSSSEVHASISTQLKAVKDTIGKLQADLKVLEKRYGQELKEARRRRRVKKETVDGEVKPSPPLCC
jgi:hypothetical protein